MGLGLTRSLCAGQCKQTLQDPQVRNAQEHQAETTQCSVSLRGIVLQTLQLASFLHISQHRILLKLEKQYHAL